MKKLFIGLLLAGSILPALAQHHGHGFRHHGHRHHSGPNWGYLVAPLVIGGIAGAAIINNNRQPETIIIQQPPQSIVQNQNCTPWTDTYSSDGTITRTRTCTN
jgi:hypothetical protein